MIIDAHVHLVGSGWVRGKFLQSSSRAFASRYNRVHGTNLTPSEYLDQVSRKYIDPNADELVLTMDKAGIDVAVIFSADWAPLTGEARITNKEVNHHFAEVAKRHPCRFWPLCALDPRRGDVLEQAKVAIEEWGMKGFKLMPSAGFYPNDPVCFPLYEKCAEWGVPVMTHSGGWEIHWEYAQPMYIASAAEAYPNVNFIMAHAGLESWQQALLAASIMPNVFLDISITGQWEYWLHSEEFYRWLRNLVDQAGPEKILFASDWPGPNSWTPLAKWVAAIREPKTKIKFSAKEREIILSRAAQKAFGIPDNFRDSQEKNSAEVKV